MSFDPFVDDIAGVFSGEYDQETGLARSELRYAVSRQVTDQRTGVVLDVRRAVLAHLTPGEGNREHTPVMEVFDATTWDAIGQQVAAACAGKNVDLRVVDGREVFAQRPARRERAGRVGEVADPYGPDAFGQEPFPDWQD